MDEMNESTSSDNQIFLEGSFNDKWILQLSWLLLLSSFGLACFFGWFKPEFVTPAIILAGCAAARLGLRKLDSQSNTSSKQTLLSDSNLDSALETVIWVMLGVGIGSLLVGFIPIVTYRTIFAGIVAAILALRSTSIEKYANGLLIQLFLLNLIVRVAAAIEYPSIVGVDPWFHTRFIEEIAKTGYLPELGQYKYFPFAHLSAAATQIMTGLNGKSLLLVAWTSIELAALLLVYKWASQLIGAHASFLGILMTSLFIHQIRWGIWPIPMAYSSVLLIVFLFIAVQSRTTISQRVIALVAISIAIITHPIGSVIFPLFTIGNTTTRMLLAKIRSRLFAAPEAKFSPTILAGVGIFTYWMYVSGTLSVMSQVAAIGWKSDQPFLFGTTVNVRSLTTILLDQAPYWLLLCLPVLGILYVLHKPPQSGQLLTISLPILALGAASLGASALGLNETLPERWFLFISILLTPSIGLALAAIMRLPRNGYIFGSLFVAGFVILNVGHYGANPAQGITATHIQRPALTAAELDAATLITSHTNRKISVDTYYMRAYPSDQALDASDFLIRSIPIQGYVALRSAVSTELIWASDPNKQIGSASLTKEQVNLLTADLFTLYDNGTVKLYQP